MNIVSKERLARKHHDIGYSLYMANQPIEACQHDDQRRGWQNAYKGHLAAGYAATDAEITAYLAKMR